MTLEIGQVVLAKAGRDKGRLLAVTAIGADRVLVCDGKERPLERPKAKNPRHLQATAMHLDPQSMATNRKLKQALRALQTK